jgi:hypothetical protein
MEEIEEAKEKFIQVEEVEQPFRPQIESMNIFYKPKENRRLREDKRIEIEVQESKA